MTASNMNISSMSTTTMDNVSSINECYINEDCVKICVNEDSAPPPQHEYSIFFEFVVPGILLNIIGLLGLIGNTLSIIVLSRPQMRQSINCILIGLASFDIILVVTSILMLGLPSIYGFLAYYSQSYENYTAPGLTIFAFYFYEVFPFIVPPMVYPIAMIVQTGSVYLTLAVTVERFVAVCLPFRARSLCTYGRARYGVILVALFATVYNLPRFWEVYGKRDLNANITYVEKTCLRNNPKYIGVYITWAYLIFMYFIPFSCLAIFNLLIYRQVRIANLERSRMSRQEQKEIGLATMLMVVVIVFFLCNVLALVVNILEAFNIAQQVFIQLNNLSNLLVTFNSSVNFIIYCIFNDKFKRIFCKLFCCQMILHKFGIYTNVGGGGGGGQTETYVHRYPDNNHRPNTTTTSASGTLLHNVHNLRSISPRPGVTIENTNVVERNSHQHLNNNSNSSNRGIDGGGRTNRLSWGPETLLVNDDVMSDEDEYCSLTKDINIATRFGSALE